MYNRRTLASIALVWLTAALVLFQPMFATPCCCANVAPSESEAAAGTSHHTRPHCCSVKPKLCCTGQHSGSCACCQGRYSERDCSQCKCPAKCCGGHTGDPSKSVLPERCASSGEVLIQACFVHGSDSVKPGCTPLIEALSSSVISGSQRCIVLCRLAL